MYNCIDNFTYDCFNTWITFKSIVRSSLPCSAALCLDLVVIDHGEVTFTGNSVGDTASYTCNSGFELIGGDTITCTQVDANSAVLQPAPPFCRREYVMHRVTTGCLACVNFISVI